MDINNKMQSPDSQRSSDSSDDSPRPGPKRQQQVQEQSMTNMRQLPLGMNPEDVYVSPYWVLTVFSIMGLLLVAFIAGVVSLLTIDSAPSTRPPVITKNNTSELLAVPPKTIKPTSALTRETQQFDTQIQQNSILSQLLRTNTNNESVDLFFARYLLENAQNFSNQSSVLHKYEREYYAKLYGDYIVEEQKQLPICVIATGRNNMGQQRQQRFLKSVSRLNYSNFQLIYVDDASSDETPGHTKQYLQQSPNLKDRSVVIEQHQQMNALSNKIKAISQCRSQDIVVDVDADDSFIGTQPLHVINHLYATSPHLWLVYTNHLVKKEGNIAKGSNRGLNNKEFESYRTLDNVWVSSHLKTFRKQLFNKINVSEWQKQNGNFYDWASDRYIMYALLELAGPKHSQFQNIIPYLYDYSAASQQIRNFQLIKPDKLRSQTLIPYQPLKSLKDQAKKVQKYQVPSFLKEHYRRAKEKQELIIKQSQTKN